MGEGSSDEKIASGLRRDLAVEPEVAAARADGEGDLTLRTSPSLSDDVPGRQVVARERDVDELLLVRGEEDVCEASEDRGRLVRVCGVVHVELGDLGPVDGAGVLDCE